MNIPVKYLCVCNWGNVRSVAVAQYIKELNGKYRNFEDKQDQIRYEAIAVGKHVMTRESLNFLFEWADYMIDVSDDSPYEDFRKDIWHNPRHIDLQDKVEKLWKRIQLEENRH